MMRIRQEEEQREKLPKWSLGLSVASFIPIIGIPISLFSFLMAVVGLNLRKRFPEKFGGLWRLRLSLLLSSLAFLLSLFELYFFFEYKLKQAENTRYELTLMRIYEASEILEDYASRTGVYPTGDNALEIKKELESAGIFFFPEKDGWSKPLIIKSQPWDYRISAENPAGAGLKKFPVLGAQSAKPVFPYVGESPVSFTDSEAPP